MIKMKPLTEKITFTALKMLPTGETFKTNKLPYYKDNIYLKLWDGCPESFICIAGEDKGSSWGDHVLKKGEDLVEIVNIEAVIIND